MNNKYFIYCSDNIPDSSIYKNRICEIVWIDEKTNWCGICFEGNKDTTLTVQRKNVIPLEDFL